MTKPKPRHQGEPVRLMSGDHGTVVVADGELYPEWFTAAPAVEEQEQEQEQESGTDDEE